MKYFSIIFVLFSFSSLVGQNLNIKKSDGTYVYFELTNDVVLYFNSPPCPGAEKVYYEGGPNNDGQDYYNTIQLGNQCWLKQNLNIGTMIHGTHEQQNNGIIEKYYYNQNLDNGATYGGLYQWAEAVAYQNNASNYSSPNPAFSGNIQGICPEGWHIPTIEEFITLQSTVEGSANSLKAVGQGTGDGIGTNKSGFSALLGGYRLNEFGQYINITIGGYFWTSSESSINKANFMSLYNNTNTIGTSNSDKIKGKSIRCIKD